MDIFDIIPENFFSILSSKNKRLYASCLIEAFKIYETGSILGTDKKLLADELTNFLENSNLAFDKDEEISTHESGGDAMVTVLEGVGKFTIDGVEYIVKKGETIVMPARHPHAVYGEEKFKMLLTVTF